MNKKNIHTVIAIFIIGLLVFTTSSYEQLQGAFSGIKSFSTANQSILTVKNNVSDMVYLAWDEKENTVGSWKLKASQNLTINGIAFHIGKVNSIGLDDTFIANYFKECTVELSQGTQILQSYDSETCYHAYLPFDLEAGQNYNLNLKAKVLSTAEDKFIEEELENKQIALSFVGLTKNDASQLSYTDSEFLTLVNQTESNSTEENGNTITLEYTFGGYILKDGLIQKKEDDNWEKTFELSPTKIQGQIEEEKTYKSNKGNVKITPSIKK